MAEVKEDKTAKKSTGHLLRDLMSGTIITDQIILKNLGYLFLLTFLGALYIANRFHAERITRETTSLLREVRELRAESLATSSELITASRQSEVVSHVRDRGLGLEELREPPFKVIVERKFEEWQ
jgi:hypothetical protein